MSLTSTEFRIHVAPINQWLTVGGDVTSATVSGLRNGVEHTVTVYAVNEHGRSPGASTTVTPLTGVEGEVAGLIVKFSDPVSPGQSGVPGEHRVQNVDLTVGRALSNDVHRVELSDRVSISVAHEIAAELAADPDVAWAEPDQFVFISQTQSEQGDAPTDPLYRDQQWNLWDEYGVGVANGADSVNSAWSSSLGAGVTVAVIDTGIASHPDLAGQIVAGYDFVSSPAHLAAPREPDGPDVDFDADGQPGWDADPTDPGDWRKVAPVRESTWHGTHIAGIIAARANNAEGITGLAPGARIQPIRALSWRGGLLSDITAAITWASGGTVTGVPANTTPSRVINLSFTVKSACTPALQAAITDANTRGSVVIAAAGNANDDVAAYAPANCEGTIAVAATGRDGKRAPYSNYGAGIDLAAPGGTLTTGTGVLSTSNPGYATREGTSIAAAHVSAAAARLVSPEADAVTPVQTRLMLKKSVRPFAGLTCGLDGPDTCGSGIVSLVQVASAATVTLDPNFNPDLQPDSSGYRVEALAIGAGGSIAVGGSYYYVNGNVYVNNLAKVSNLGTIDSAFRNAMFVAPSYYGVSALGVVYALAVQSDGKLLVGGVFTEIGSTSVRNLARLNSDGSLDTSFAASVNGDVWAIAVLPNGKIVIGGQFWSAGAGTSSGHRYLARLNADGSLDQTFTPALETNPNNINGVNDLVVQPDGKIIAAGDVYKRVGSRTYQYIARFGTDGSIDETFYPQLNGGVRAVGLQSDGSIVIGGQFTSVGAGPVQRSRLARFSSDGTLDEGFNPSANDAVWSLVVQPDDKVIIGGYFTIIDGQSMGRLARLTSTGSLDPTFSNPNLNRGTNANVHVYALALDEECRLVVGGNFFKVGSTTRNKMARFLTDCAPGAPTNVVAGAGTASASVSWSAPTSVGSSPVVSYTVTAKPGNATCVSSTTECQVPGLTPGVSYTFTVTATNDSGTGPASRASSAVVPSASPSADGGSGGSSAPSPGASDDTQYQVKRVPPPAQPELAVRAPGSALIRVLPAIGEAAETESSVVVVPTPRRDGKVVRAPSWDVELQGVEESGVPAPLNADGHLEVVQGRGLLTSGRGFAANAPVGVYLFSEPRTLGTLTTDARGSFTGMVPVPTDVPVGVHTAQVSGYTPNGDILIISLGIEVAEPVRSPLLTAIPDRVKPLRWMRLVDERGEVVIRARSQGCSATDDRDRTGARGTSLVFWGVGTCLIEIRTQGRVWSTNRITVAATADDVPGVRPLAQRRIWFTAEGSMTERSRQVLARALPRMQASQASYAYWLDSRDRALTGRVAGMQANLNQAIRTGWRQPTTRSILVGTNWQDVFQPRAFDHVVIAWQPVQQSASQSPAANTVASRKGSAS